MVYLVRGSEDGALGIYTNKKKAAERASMYLEHHKKAPSFNEIYRVLCKQGYAYLNLKDSFVSVDIEPFILNN